jgi:EmrB/QacA subfamily drug resistance transporter
LAAAVFVVANDFTALGIVVPTLEHDFSTSISTAQWVVNGYSLAFAMAVVPAGRFADLFGPTRMFRIGALIFAVSSIVIAVAPDIWLVLGGRVVQGLGGASMWTATIAMVFSAFGQERAGAAGAFVLGIAGVGNALGPIDAGILTDTIGWEWVLLLNVPLCAFAVLALRGRVEMGPSGSEDRSIDWTGIGLLATALMALLLTLDYVPREGWTGALSIIGFAVAIGLLAVFTVQQKRRGERALIPPAVTGNRRFLVSCACAGLLATTFFAILLYGPQLMTKVLGSDPITAGLQMAPLMGAFAGSAYFGGKLYDRFGPRITVASGGALMTIGTFLLTQIPDSPVFGDVVPGFVLLGLGTGVMFPAVAAAGISSLPERLQGIAGGVLYMAQVAGGAIGIGATTSIITARTADELAKDDKVSHLTRGEIVDLQGILSGTDSAAQALAKLSTESADRVRALATDAFVVGFRSGLFVDVALGAIGVVVALLGYRALARPDTGPGASSP